jgi:hypothetical protein
LIALVAQVQYDLSEIYKFAMKALAGGLEDQNREMNEKIKEKDDQIAQLTATSLTDDIKTCLTDETLKDFTLINNGQRFKIHKMALAARSTVFAMVVKLIPEAIELDLSEIIDRDIPVVTFRMVLEFVYHDRIPTKHDRLISLYWAAKKLDIKSLKNAIVQKLSESLCKENVFDLLEFAIKNEISDLTAIANDKVQEIFPDKKLTISTLSQCSDLRKIYETMLQTEQMMKKYNQ